MRLSSYIPLYLFYHLSLQQNWVYCFFVPHFFDILSSIVGMGCFKACLLMAASHVHSIDTTIHCMLFNLESSLCLHCQYLQLLYTMRISYQSPWPLIGPLDALAALGKQPA